MNDILRKKRPTTEIIKRHKQPKLLFLKLFKNEVAFKKKKVITFHVHVYINKRPFQFIVE